MDEVIYMGYRIEYEHRTGKYEIRKDRFPVWLLAAGLLFLGICLISPKGMTTVLDFLIPGEVAVTVQAFRNMTCDLRSGADLGEAFYAFCRYIVHGT